MKIDLACGQSPKEGFEGADRYAPNAKYKIDLLKFPWPWANDSVQEFYSSHFIEHIPMDVIDELSARRYTYEPETVLPGHPWYGQDLFFRFFDEMYRCIHREGVINLIWPDLQTCRAFMDPTHRRFLPAQATLYLNEQWRKDNKLDHYLIKCNFAGNVNPTIQAELALLHPEAQARRFNEGWNTKFDNICTLKPIKP